MSIEIGDWSIGLGVKGLPVNRTLLALKLATDFRHQFYVATRIWDRQQGEDHFEMYVHFRMKHLLTLRTR